MGPKRGGSLLLVLPPAEPRRDVLTASPVEQPMKTPASTQDLVAALGELGTRRELPVSTPLISDSLKWIFWLSWACVRLAA